MDQNVTIAPQYLTLERQERLMGNFMQHAENARVEEVFYFRHGGDLAVIPALINALVYWNAGFRGYGLKRYGKGRVMTLIVPAICSFSGKAYTEAIGTLSLVEPFRREDSLYYGIRYAAGFQLSNLTTATAGMVMTFFYAQRNGVLLVPQTKFIFKTPVDAFGLMFTRLKPYRYTLLASWLGSTAIMFAVGVASYNETRKVLRERFNRQSLSFTED